MSESAKAPKGWFLAGSRPADYEIGIEPAVYGERSAAYLRARRRATSEGFGTMMQQFKADAYRGQRLRLSAAVRARDVGGWAGLWMRVDGTERRTLAFDNMQGRPITGTTGWATQAVVLDVAERESSQVAFGVLLSGPGEVWIADVRVEAVGPDVPTTGAPRPPLPDHPVNLDFAEPDAA